MQLLGLLSLRVVDDGVHINNSRERDIVYEFATFICDVDVVAPVSDSQKYIGHGESKNVIRNWVLGYFDRHCYQCILLWCLEMDHSEAC